ncbi:MAG: hypothetical protein WCK67_09700 [bacterium]
MNINKINNFNTQPIAFKGNQRPSVEMLAFSSKANSDMFLKETEDVRKNDLVDGQSFFSFIKDRASAMFNAMNETTTEQPIEAGLNLIG